MDCRRFRQQHVEFVDDTLPGVAMVAMRRHLRSCAACAELDTRVRRSLLVFRNQPRIEPSPEFRARLFARLREDSPLDAAASIDAALRRAPAFWRPNGAAGLFSAAAGLLAAGLLVVAAANVGERDEPLVLPPVVASIPETAHEPMANSALLASVSSGMTVWSAVLMAEQAPMRFAGSEFQLTSWGR
ncbi:MAG TPA: zf-HC2 domain-containing protein [Gemmatimonadaceae bacterium]